MGVDSYDDLYWLRKIRDANPTSQLPNLWLDTEDHYTQWEGVEWDAEEIRVVKLNIANANVTTLINVNKLTALQYIYCYSNQLTTQYRDWETPIGLKLYGIIINKYKLNYLTK